MYLNYANQQKVNIDRKLCKNKDFDGSTVCYNLSNCC